MSQVRTTNAVSESYRKDDPEAAARCLDRAIAHYCSKGNFRRAATHKQNLAELYEVELGDNTRAAAAYEEAAGWYESVSLSIFIYLHSKSLKLEHKY
jgi:alpha-soluble NSF attachment protein